MTRHVGRDTRAIGADLLLSTDGALATPETTRARDARHLQQIARARARLPLMPPRKRQPSSTARGLGYEHKKIRDALLYLHIDGTPCPCLQMDDCGSGCPCRRAGRGLPMYRDPKRNVDGRPLEADHTTPRSRGGRRADRLLLSRCNRGRKDGAARSPHQQPDRIDTDRDW